MKIKMEFQLRTLISQIKIPITKNLVNQMFLFLFTNNLFPNLKMNKLKIKTIFKLKYYHKMIKKIKYIKQISI